MDALSSRVQAQVASAVRGLESNGLSPVDVATYRHCAGGQCWDVHTATYLLFRTDLTSHRLCSLFREHLGGGEVKVHCEPFQWLHGDGVALSFSSPHGLLGRYLFVMVPFQREESQVLQFKPSPSVTKPGVSEGRPMVAIVIDDIGYTKRDADRFLQLPFPITVSIIPFTPFVSHAIRLAKARGKEVMLHIPMESGGHREAIERMEERTKGMLRVSMSDAAIESMVRREIAAVPGAIGANNHMGSRFTRNRHKMEVVLRELKRHGMFFLDSLTSSRSVGYRTALKMGVPALKRDVFLDHSHKQEAMDRQFRRLASIALKRGYAVAIGHPFLSTYRMIKVGASKLRSMGIEIVPISRLLRRVEGVENGRSGFQETRKSNG